MLIPLSIDNINNMGVKEIVDRINFITKTKQDKKKAELKSFVNLMHFAMSAANSPSKKTNKIFHQEMGKIFKEPQKPEESYEEVMNLGNNVKK